MIAFLQSLSPVIQALLATCFTWAMTALGAATVFATKDVSKRVLDTMLGFATQVPNSGGTARRKIELTDNMSASRIWVQ
jgi:zinc transporter ZupT